MSYGLFTGQYHLIIFFPISNLKNLRNPLKKKKKNNTTKNFTVLLKKFSGEEGERVDVQKLFGYIGLFTLLALWWLGKSVDTFGINFAYNKYYVSIGQNNFTFFYGFLW